MSFILLWCYGMLNILNMIEHTVGCYLLYRRRKEFLLLLLFSICNFIYAGVNFGFFLVIITETSTEIYIIYATLMRIPFYWLMIMLTLERFLVVYLHLKYKNCIFEKYKFKLAMLSWVIFIVLTTITVILYKVYNYGNFYNNQYNSMSQKVILCVDEVIIKVNNVFLYETCRILITLGI